MYLKHLILAGLKVLNLIFKSENTSLVYGFLFCFFINANIDLLNILFDLRMLFDESIWLNIGIRSVVASILIFIAGEKSYQWFKAKLDNTNTIKA